MYTLKVIQHYNIPMSELDEIIKIKSVSWPYSYMNQLKWIRTNLKKSDLHIILFQNSTAVAYLNLIKIDLEIDNKLVNAFGMGNVCAIEKGKGYGNELMKQTNQYIIEKEKVGLLFCKKELVGFYVKHGWIWVDKNKLQLPFNNSNVETLVFNQSCIFTKLLYNGKSF